MSEQHSAATVALQTQSVQRITLTVVVLEELQVRLVFVAWTQRNKAENRW